LGYEERRCWANCSRMLVSKIFSLCSPDPPTSQTNGQTTCDRKTALCIIVHRAVIKRRFQQYLVRTEILSTFNTRVEYIYRRTIRHSAHSNEWGSTQSSLQQCVSLPSHQPLGGYMHSLSAFIVLNVVMLSAFCIVYHRN